MEKIIDNIMKIACVCGFYAEFGVEMNEDQIKMHEIMFKSAKKYLLNDCDPDFFFVTNLDIKINNVKNIKIKDKVNCFYDMLMMKIFCYRYFQDYDYIFILEGDEIFVNHITKDNLLPYDFNVLNGIGQPPVEAVLQLSSKKIKINGDLKDKIWKVGCFFGGKKEVFLELYKFSLVNYNLLFNEDIYNEKYWMEEERYTDEVFLNKFFIENNYNINCLTYSDVTSLENENRKSNFFLCGFHNTEEFKEVVDNGIHYAKMLHDTKKDVKFLEENFKNYYE